MEDDTYVESPNSPHGSWIVSFFTFLRLISGLRKMNEQGIPSPSPSPFREAYHDDMRPPFELAQML
jgi:hypothetical protein